MSKSRVFRPAEKVVILKRHLVEKVPVSDMCDKHRIHVKTFYHWFKVFFENGAAAFAAVPTKPAIDPRDRTIELSFPKIGGQGVSGVDSAREGSTDGDLTAD